MIPAQRSVIFCVTQFQYLETREQVRAVADSLCHYLSTCMIRPVITCRCTIAAVINCRRIGCLLLLIADIWAFVRIARAGAVCVGP